MYMNNNTDDKNGGSLISLSLGDIEGGRGCSSICDRWECMMLNKEHNFYGDNEKDKGG